jgi:hypothetical protein
LPNTVVHLKTQEEYDEYMQMCEEAGWVWCDMTKPASYNVFAACKEFCVPINNRFTHSRLGYYSQRGYKSITLGELKEICNMWEPKQGDKVLVKNKDNTNWYMRTFVVKHRNKYYCEYTNDANSHMGWEYCKPLKKYTVTIDGKDIELSEESFNNLKEQLCGE